MNDAQTICLLPNCSFISEASRMLEIHRALVARGADVRVGSHGGPHEHVFVDAGVEFDRLGEPMSDERARQFASSVPGMVGPKSNMWTVEELRRFVNEEVEYMNSIGAAAAVTGWCNSAMISTRVVGIPLITEHAGSFLPPLWENGLLPVPSNPSVLLLKVLPKPLAVKAMNYKIPRERGYVHNFNVVAREFGVEELPGLAAMMMGDLALVTDVPEMFGFSEQEVNEWQPQDPSAYRRGVRLRYSGPLFAKLALDLPPRVDAFLEREPIYIAITSSDESLVRGVIGALRELERPLLVASTVHDLADLESDDLMVEPFLPNHEVMPRASLVVSAGGQGSIQTAMASGVPLLAMPLQPEQDTNIVLAERAGAARLISLKHAVTPRAAKLAAEMLSTAGYRAAAERMRDAYAGVDGPARTADAILEFAGLSVAPLMADSRR